MTMKHLISNQKKYWKMEKKKVQDCVHNYLKSKETTHPINHCECNSDVSD